MSGKKGCALIILFLIILVALGAVIYMTMSKDADNPAGDATGTEDTNERYKTYNGFRYYADGDQIWIVDYKGTEANLVIPAVIDGKQVAGLYENSFRDNASIVSVEFQGAALDLRGDNFNGCTSLTTVTFNEGEHYIGDRAFANCPELVTVDFQKMGLGIQIGADAFVNSPKLSGMTIPAGIGSIGEHAFGYTTEDYSSYNKVEGFTLSTQGADSAGEKYAEANNMK